MTLADQPKPEGYYSSARTDLVALVRGPAGAVLDIGCGNGATGAFMLEHDLARTVVGIEIVAEQAEEARAVLDQVHVGDVASVLESLVPERVFDCVLLGDVLEHLVDPWSTFDRILRRVAHGGEIVVSLPNVRSVEVLLPLVLRGRWEYRPDGILDQTHLRYFTRRSALAFFHQAGLQPSDCVPYFTGRRYAYLDRLSFGLLQEFVAQRYLFRLQRP